MDNKCVARFLSAVVYWTPPFFCAVCVINIFLSNPSRVLHLEMKRKQSKWEIEKKNTNPLKIINTNANENGRERRKMAFCVHKERSWPSLNNNNSFMRVVAAVILLSYKQSLKYACRPHKQKHIQSKTKRTHIITDINSLRTQRAVHIDNTTKTLEWKNMKKEENKLQEELNWLHFIQSSKRRKKQTRMREKWSNKRELCGFNLIFPFRREQRRDSRNIKNIFVFVCLSSLTILELNKQRRHL